jgi:hypothetical protein
MNCNETLKWKNENWYWSQSNEELFSIVQSILNRPTQLKLQTQLKSSKTTRNQFVSENFSPIICTINQKSISWLIWIFLYRYLNFMIHKWPFRNFVVFTVNKLLNLRTDLDQEIKGASRGGAKLGESSRNESVEEGTWMKRSEERKIPVATLFTNTNEVLKHDPRNHSSWFYVAAFVCDFQTRKLIFFHSRLSCHSNRALRQKVPVKSD